MAVNTIKYFILTVCTSLIIYQLANSPPGRHSKTCLLSNGKFQCPKFRYSGTVDPKWEKILHDIEHNFNQGYEIGNAISIWYNGTMVVNITTGYDDCLCTTPYKKDTIQMIFSSTKAWTSIAIAMLVDRGLLEYDKPVSNYWPEFGINGKGSVTVSDLMSHAGGVHGVSKPIGQGTILRDGPRPQNTALSMILAETVMDERTWRQRGNQGYHGLSRGLYANEIVKRADLQGRNIQEFIQDEIVKPLNLDFHIGLSGVDDAFRARTGNMCLQPLWKLFFGFIPRILLPRYLWSSLFNDIFMDESEIQLIHSFRTTDSVAKAAFMKIWGEPNPPQLVRDYKKKNLWQDILSPSSHGFSNAYSLARLGSVMLNGGIDPISGTKLMSNETVQLASTYYPATIDSILVKNISYTIGGFGDISSFARHEMHAQQDEINNVSMENKCLGWAGAGGSIFQWCPEYQLAIGYTMNYYSVHGIDWRGIGYLKRAMSIVDNMQ